MADKAAQDPNPTPGVTAWEGARSFTAVQEWDGKDSGVGTGEGQQWAASEETVGLVPLIDHSFSRINAASGPYQSKEYIPLSILSHVFPRRLYPLKERPV